MDDRYSRPIEATTSLEAMLADPDRHPGCYFDRDVVHVRDVAQRAAEPADTLDGVLLAPRSPEHSAFVQGCAVLQAHVHDIGMSPQNTASTYLPATGCALREFLAADLIDRRHIVLVPIVPVRDDPCGAAWKGSRSGSPSRPSRP